MKVFNSSKYCDCPELTVFLSNPWQKQMHENSRTTLHIRQNLVAYGNTQQSRIFCSKMHTCVERLLSVSFALNLLFIHLRLRKNFYKNALHLTIYLLKYWSVEITTVIILMMVSSTNKTLCFTVCLHEPTATWKKLSPVHSPRL